MNLSRVSCENAEKRILILRRIIILEKLLPAKWTRAYAKERLIKFHGVSKNYFPFYLKEMEFRYNHRRDNLFELLAKYACDLV